MMFLYWWELCVVEREVRSESFHRQTGGACECDKVGYAFDDNALPIPDMRAKARMDQEGQRRFLAERGLSTKDWPAAGLAASDR
jgi:hypothetical protein